MVRIERPEDPPAEWGEGMRGYYLTKFYVNGVYAEETIFALNQSAARKIIEAKYAGAKFRWANMPQLIHNSISRL